MFFTQELQELRQRLAESEKSSEAKSRVEEELKNKANELQRIQDELSVVKRENSVSPETRSFFSSVILDVLPL